MLVSSKQRPSAVAQSSPQDDERSTQEKTGMIRRTAVRSDRSPRCRPPTRAASAATGRELVRSTVGCRPRDESAVGRELVPSSVGRRPRDDRSALPSLLLTGSFLFSQEKKRFVSPPPFFFPSLYSTFSTCPLSLCLSFFHDGTTSTSAVISQQWPPNLPPSHLILINATDLILMLLGVVIMDK